MSPITLWLGPDCLMVKENRELHVCNFIPNKLIFFSPGNGNSQCRADVTFHHHLNMVELKCQISWNNRHFQTASKQINVTCKNSIIILWNDDCHFLIYFSCFNHFILINAVLHWFTFQLCMCILFMNIVLINNNNINKMFIVLNPKQCTGLLFYFIFSITFCLEE